MLAEPITVTVDAVARVLPRVNSDNYGSHYRLLGSGFMYELIIRHTTENAKLGAPQVDRHNVDFKYTTYDVDGVATVYQVYSVIRTPQGADPTIVEKMWVGFNTFTTANDGAIISWQS